MDVWTVKETCLDRFYDLARLHPDDVRVVVDLGAGFGDFAIYAASRYPHSTVYAYEPSPVSFARLKANVRLNRADRVHCFPLAVGGGTRGRSRCTRAPGPRCSTRRFVRARRQPPRPYR